MFLRVSDSIPEDLQDMFWFKCKFAFECLSQDKIAFSEKEIAPLFPQVLDSSDKLLCFGLLQCARSLLPVGQSLSFHFVHLTIQEFLAALHLVTLPNEEKLKVCEAHLRSVRFAMVWRFVFGLGCQKEGSYSRKVVCLDDEVVDRFLNTRHDDFSHLQLMFCHCALESQSNSVSHKIAKRVNGTFKLGFDFNTHLVGLGYSIAATPFDCVAVFHVLRYTTPESKIMIFLNNCGLTDKLLKELTDFLFSSDVHVVRELELRGNKITDKSITDLFNRGSVSFSSLESLNLSGNGLTSFSTRLLSLMKLDLSSNSITNISQLLLSSKRLSDLFLSENPLGVSGIQSLETAVQAGVLVNLRKLYLSNTLTDDADINGALLATLSPSIASHCPHLRRLDLSRNNLGVPGANALGRLFISNTSTFGGLVKSIANSMTALFGVSHNPYSLNFSNAIQHEFELNLSNANINAEAVVSLNILCSKPSLDCELILSNNPLGYDGLFAIFRMLGSETCPITLLDLANTDLTTPVNTESQYHNTQLPKTSSVLNLGPGIKNSRLTELYLNNNNFSGDRALILAECVMVGQSLVRLYSWSCSLTSSEVIRILDHLKSNSHKNLRKWDLCKNSIDDEGVNALIENIPQLFPKLEEVDLMISGEIEERLKKLLKANKEECESREEAERRAESERLQAEQRDERVRLAVEEEVQRSAVLTEWERTCSPPQSEETFHEMWAELLEELVYGILDHPTIESVHNLDHWNLVVCEGIPVEIDPQKQLELTHPTRHSFLSSSEDSATEDYPAPPSDDERLHPATEELDEPVGPPPTATDESTPPTVPHRMDQQEGVSTDQTVDLTTPPQTTSFHPISGVCGLKTVTIEGLKDCTKVTDAPLDTEIEEADMILLAVHFDNVETLSVQLRLTPADRQDVKEAKLQYNTQTAVDKALRLWRKANPGAATYRALVEIVLRLGVNSTAIAEEVVKFSALKASSQEHEQSSS